MLQTYKWVVVFVGLLALIRHGNCVGGGTLGSLGVVGLKVKGIAFPFGACVQQSLDGTWQIKILGVQYTPVFMEHLAKTVAEKIALRHIKSPDGEESFIKVLVFQPGSSSGVIERSVQKVWHAQANREIVGGVSWIESYYIEFGWIENVTEEPATEKYWFKHFGMPDFLPGRIDHKNKLIYIERNESGNIYAAQADYPFQKLFAAGPANKVPQFSLNTPSLQLVNYKLAPDHGTLRELAFTFDEIQLNGHYMLQKVNGDNLREELTVGVLTDIDDEGNGFRSEITFEEDTEGIQKILSALRPHVETVKHLPMLRLVNVLLYKMNDPTLEGMHVFGKYQFVENPMPNQLKMKVGWVEVGCDQGFYHFLKIEGIQVPLFGTLKRRPKTVPSNEARYTFEVINTWKQSDHNNIVTRLRTARKNGMPFYITGPLKGDTKEECKKEELQLALLKISKVDEAGQVIQIVFDLLGELEVNGASKLDTSSKEASRKESVTPPSSSGPSDLGSHSKNNKRNGRNSKKN